MTSSMARARSLPTSSNSTTRSGDSSTLPITLGVLPLVEVCHTPSTKVRVKSQKLAISPKPEAEMPKRHLVPVVPEVCVTVTVSPSEIKHRFTSQPSWIEEMLCGSQAHTDDAHTTSFQSEIEEDVIGKTSGTRSELFVKSDHAGGSDRGSHIRTDHSARH